MVLVAAGALLSDSLARAAQSPQPLPSDLSRVALRVGLTTPGGGYAIVTLPLETYVARVLAGEAARDSRPAALEALAITIRTYALANRGRHRADGFDFCDRTHCQVVRPATPATERAAVATAGQLLLYGHAAADVYYSASCGGRTEVPSAVWPGAADPPFLPSHDDDACGGSPAWTAELGTGDLLRALRAAGFRGDRLREVRIAARTASGRVARLRLDGLEPEQISGQDLRVAVGRTLGWQHIKSTAFDLRRAGDAYRFSGHGSGHGVGLCVIGSARLAETGQNATDILRRYFPGLEIAAPGPKLVASAPDPGAFRSAPARPSAATGTAGTRGRGGAASPAPAGPEVLVAIPEGDEGERTPTIELAARARDELARELGVPVPTRITVRFHPTIESYELATSRPWFTSGAVVNGEVHLVPLAVLRDRGSLERTIRHEIVHVLCDATLAKRPLWVREGIASYFAGTRPIPGEPNARPKLPPRVSCPDDAELSHPVSIGALGMAYARAKTCVERQLANGRTWQDVK